MSVKNLLNPSCSNSSDIPAVNCTFTTEEEKHFARILKRQERFGDVSEESSMLHSSNKMSRHKLNVNIDNSFTCQSSNMKAEKFNHRWNSEQGSRSGCSDDMRSRSVPKQMPEKDCEIPKNFFNKPGPGGHLGKAGVILNYIRMKRQEADAKLQTVKE